MPELTENLLRLRSVPGVGKATVWNLIRSFGSADAVLNAAPRELGSAVRGLTREKAALYSGNDDHIVPVLSLGGAGVVSVLANVVPRYVHDMVAAYHAGDVEKACDMQLAVNPLVSALFSEVNPIPVKTALRLMGYDMGPFRLPLTEMEEKNLNALTAQLKSFKLI